MKDVDQHHIIRTLQIKVARVPEGQTLKHQMLKRVYISTRCHLLMVGIQNGTTALENSWTVSLKVNILLTYDSAIVLLVFMHMS